MVPRLSIVVVMYNMQRELQRTLHTLSSSYQRDVEDEAYEVIVVANGSRPAIDEAVVASFGSNVRLLRVEVPSHSPVSAINLGLASARGENVAIMVDGARMLTPGVVSWTLDALRLYGDAVVTMPSWHLGPDVQNRSMRLGYCQGVEDALLEEVDWRGDGYRLFDCCERPDPSSEGALWFGVIAESNFVACRREIALDLGGFDPGFTSRGGGACNLDFFGRLVDAGHPVVSLFGEGTFHQVHGGVSTNVTQDEHPWLEIEAEYRTVRGRAWREPKYDPIVFGRISDNAKQLLARSPNIFTNAPHNVPARWLRRGLGDVALRLAMMRLKAPAGRQRP